MSDYTMKFKYVDGWMGGHFEANGEKVVLRDKPPAILIIDGRPYDAIYQPFYGTDSDHGHNYPWQIMDIGVIDGDIKKRFLSVRKLKDHEIKIEFLE
jgi:hypothetical protein